MYNFNFWTFECRFFVSGYEIIHFDYGLGYFLRVKFLFIRLLSNLGPFFSF